MIPNRQVVPALLQVDAVLGRLAGDAAISGVCRFLHHEFPHFAWVGVYRLQSSTLHLAGWAGDAPTEHTQIEVGQGLCGLAARDNATVLVGDVRERPEYLACFPTTLSEVVVPIRAAGQVIGEIDVDGNALRAFDATDAHFLELVAAKLAAPLQPGTGPLLHL